MLTPLAPPGPPPRDQPSAGASSARWSLLLVALRVRRGERGPAGDTPGKVVDPTFTVSGATLEDTNSEPYSLTEDTDKRLTLVFFGYTHCPDMCQAGAGQPRLGDDPARRADRDQVEIVFVTSDPAGHPETIRSYLDRFDARSSGSPARWTRSRRSRPRSRSAWGTSSLRRLRGRRPRHPDPRRRHRRPGPDLLVADHVTSRSSPSTSNAD